MRRRRFIRLAGLVASTPLAYFARCASTLAAAEVSVREYGAKGDGVADDTAAVVNAIQSNLNAIVRVPVGTYLIRNPVYIRDFSGRLQCDPGARFLFLNSAAPGWSFQGGSGATLINFRSGWRSPGGARNGSSAALQLDRTFQTWVEGCIVENSNGAGINCWFCSDPTIRDAAVANTLGGGIVFANCQKPVLLNAVTDNTGDNGVEFTKYGNDTSSSGGYARNVTVRNSAARGICVTGQSFVEINQFSIDTTASSGILCATHGNSPEAPDKVRITNGVIRNAGMFSPAIGNRFGIEVHAVQSVSLSAVTVIGSASRGISVHADSGVVSLRDILVSAPLSDSGANLRAYSLNIDVLHTENTPSYGIFIANCGSVSGRRLATLNASQANPMRRAIWLEDNDTVDLQLLNIVDDQPVSTGFIAGWYGGQQRGVVRSISSDILGPQGLVLDTKGSPGISVLDT